MGILEQLRRGMPSAVVATIIVLAVSSALPARAGQTVIEPEADTWIGIGDKDDQTANHGDEPRLELGRFSIFSDLAILIRFDLADLPGDSVRSATLRLFEATPAYDDDDQFIVRAITEPWHELTVTGETAPGDGDPTIEVESSANPVIDVTAIVQAWAGGTVANNGFLIQNAGFNDYGTFVSREGDGMAATLTVEFEDTASCAEDFDDDGVVATTDLLDLLAAWGPCAPSCPEDLDDSGAVDVEDLLQLLAAWGPCPS